MLCEGLSLCLCSLTVGLVSRIDPSSSHGIECLGSARGEKRTSFTLHAWSTAHRSDKCGTIVPNKREHMTHRARDVGWVWAWPGVGVGGWVCVFTESVRSWVSTTIGEEKVRKPPRVLECTHTWRGLHRHSRILCACTWTAGQVIRSANVTDHILTMGPWMVGRTTDMVMVSLDCEQCRREGVVGGGGV